MTISDGGCYRYRKEKRIDKTPIDILTLIAKWIYQVVVLCHQQLVDHCPDIMFTDSTVIQLFDMYYWNNTMILI